MYYIEKGFWCMIISRFTNLITLAFTILFSTFLFLYIDWSSLLFCSDTDGCDQAVGLRQHVFSKYAIHIDCIHTITQHMYIDSLIVCHISCCVCMLLILYEHCMYYISPSFLEILVFLYFSIFSLFWLWNLVSFVYSIRDAYEISHFYADELGIVDVRTYIYDITINYINYTIYVDCHLIVMHVYLYCMSIFLLLG